MPGSLFKCPAAMCSCLGWVRRQNHAGTGAAPPMSPAIFPAANGRGSPGVSADPVIPLKLEAKQKVKSGKARNKAQTNQVPKAESLMAGEPVPRGLGHVGKLSARAKIYSGN